jgi:hypothetical protein
MSQEEYILQGASQSTCQHCHQSLVNSGHNRSSYCLLPDCQRARLHREGLKQKSLAREEIIKVANRHLTTSGLPVPASANIALLPANTESLQRADTERQEAFLDHLSAIYDDVKQGHAQANITYSDKLDPFETKTTGDLLGKACASCKGHCCGLGDTHAFQDYWSLKLYLEKYPDLSERQLIEEYSALFPYESYEGACVFQGESGCTLNSDMRSITCHNYQCAGLIDYKEQIVHSKKDLTFAGALSGQNLINVTVFDDSNFKYVKEARPYD